MIISRTPLRMSFVGGGSDIPAFYRMHGGAVISTTINKYVYVSINKKFDSGIRIAYSKIEDVKSVNDIEHKIVKYVMQYLKIDGGVEITSTADIPSQGTGLGSSSSFTAGLIHALNAYKGNYISSEKIGSDSCHVELDLCKEPIGKQDQYAAAYGGFNLIEFKKDNSINVSPIICKPQTLMQLEENILMFYTGITRSASSLLKRQSEEISSNLEKQNTMKKMVNLTYSMYDELSNNNINAFGEILNENWNLKKNLTNGISSKFIDECYDSAISAGAIGGKILGAGAGGFLIFYAPKERHPKIKSALNKLREIDFNFENSGSKIIFYN